MIRHAAADLSIVGILEQSIGARNRVGIGLLYRPTRLHRLAESILGFLKSLKIPSPEIEQLIVVLRWVYFSRFTGVKNPKFFDLRLTFGRHLLCRLILLSSSREKH